MVLHTHTFRVQRLKVVVFWREALAGKFHIEQLATDSGLKRALDASSYNALVGLAVAASPLKSKRRDWIDELKESAGIKKTARS